MSEQAAGRRRRGRIGLIVAGTVVLLGALLAGFMLLRPQPAASVTTRTFTSPVTKTTEQLTVNLTGTLAPQKEADLSFGTSGKVTAVSATVGQTVKTGQVLATIDDTQLKNAVTLAQANVDAAQASLDSVESGTSPTDAQIANAQAQVNSAQAKLDSAKASLSQAQLTSTIDGTVASVNLTVGNQVSGSGGSGGSSGTSGASSGSSASGTGGSASGSSSSGTAQVVVISPTSWMVNSTVGPADRASIQPGQAVTATVTGTTTTTTGKVNTVGVVATTSGGTTTFPVNVLLDGNPAGLYDGVSVNLAVTTGTFPDVLTVPTLALTTSSGATTVEKVVDGQAQTTQVETGKIFGDRTQITSGLAEGDQVQITMRSQAGAQRSASAGGIQFPGFGGAGGAGGGSGRQFGGSGNGGDGGFQRGSGTGG